MLIEDNEFLKEDASNLSAFLYKLQVKEPKLFKKMEKTINLIAPYFERFILKPSVSIEDSIVLSWKEKSSEKIFNVSQLSDGTLRMICLIALLMQPELPKVIILDEPELGLHPYSIGILAELIKSASENGTQLVISSQSVTLINHFSVNDIIVVDRKDKESTFRRLSEKEFSKWLEDYSIGELWEKNVLGGRP
jgi:predicted ATPase